jgi:glycosyltransferase involved in cell wall biosynthesis
MKKLAIVSTHPIQYNAPVYKLLSERKKIHIKVFYTWENSKDGVFDIKFNQNIKWDIPLLEGYEYEFVKNTSKKQGSHSFKGIINPNLNKQIEKWGANAVLIFGWNFHSHIRAMRYFKGKIPVFFRGDSTLIDEKPGLKTILRRIILKTIFKKIDFAFYVGKNSKDYFLKHGLKEKSLVYAPHAIDNERFIDSNRKYDSVAIQWQQDLGIKKEDIVFLYAGKFESKKDPEILINAANHLNSDKYKFIFAGDGFLKNQLYEMANKNINIVFLPFQNQSIMPVLYRLCDVFVLPSKGPGETWGLGVNEAMACSRAILVSDKVGCAPDLVQNGKNGYIFKAGDIEDLVKRIGNFNKENCITFGNNSFKMIQDFSFKNIANAIESAINKLKN